MKFDRENMMRVAEKEKLLGPTPRRLAAAKRALARQREKLPLFADEIAAGQPTPEERIRMFDDAYISWRKKMRAFTASMWLKGRALLREMPEMERNEFLDYWNHRWKGPKRAEYFLDILRTKCGVYHDPKQEGL